MNAFIHPDFLLDTALARRLYHEVAADLPVLDYHSHLPPADIAARRTFRNLADLWLGGDHYKWRLMRTAGVAEALITGDAPDEAKFHAFCRVLPLAIGNPVQAWCHLELSRLFGVDLLINEANAGRIWTEVNARLAGMDAWSFLDQGKVEVACTTDDPADDLAPHAAIAASALGTRVLPAFRPDRAMRINQPSFPAYLERLGAVRGAPVGTFAALQEALGERVAYFHDRGARCADHALDQALPGGPAGPAQLEALFAKRLGGQDLSGEEVGRYLRGLLEGLGRAYAAHGWVMCLHLGARRDVSRRQLARLGPDSGFDAVGDPVATAGLADLLDALDAGGQLPRTLLFCLHPALNEVLSTLTGCFQEDGVAGKVQFGPAWWFNDHQDGNLQQLRTLASHGVLGTFVGMVTDSRSFASYPRHDYFRRLLCRQLGHWVESGAYPGEDGALDRIVHAVCYGNAKRCFGF